MLSLSNNITIKFLSAEERFMFGIGMLLARPVPLHHSANFHGEQRVSKWELSLGELTIETNERELTRGTGWFVLVKESCLQTDSVADHPSQIYTYTWWISFKWSTVTREHEWNSLWLIIGYEIFMRWTQAMPWQHITANEYFVFPTIEQLFFNI